jgi:hypothetical protein
MLRPTVVLGVLLAALTTACTDEITEPNREGLSGRTAGTGRPPKPLTVDPKCLPGCTETDPFPALPGIFLTSGVTPEVCILQGTDHDNDGLSTRCENDLAAAFAPYMRHHSGDDVTRQSYWAARPWTNDRVRLMYLFGYFFDDGVQGGNDMLACKALEALVQFGECEGHHGDSEHVIMDVYYNWTTKHWLLDHFELSHHAGYIKGNKSATKGYPTGFHYSRRLGADPIIWVAQGKHANYPTQAACDAGNGGGYLVDLVVSFDTCGGNNNFFRATTGGTRNIGSNTVRRIDCVDSEVFGYQTPQRQECIWTGAKFTGWQLDRSTWAESYGPILARVGFGQPQ